MPMPRAARMTRTAISPRLAIRIFLNMRYRAPALASQRDVVVLLPRIAQLLAAQHGEGAADAAPGAVRHDHVVDEAAAAGDEGIGEFLAIFLGARLDLGGVAQIAAKDDLDRALGT